ncbi:ABC transporter substrate-binding protein [Desulfococcus sp.]|uniref:ABC transporter substrate-binding protein n=1 Tax=Desulfococcus sp. TaxID=2025834 RepID=UPI00359444FD
MTGLKRIVFLWILAAAVCLQPAAACADGIVIALGSEPTTLDPQLREDGGERAVNDNIYETLLQRTPAGELVAGLAAAPPSLVEPSIWEVKLRAGVTFHNGEPFNADTVVYSILRTIDPKFNSEQMSFFNTIKTAVKVDDLTVRITTDGPDPILPSRLYWMKMVPVAHSRDAKFAEAPVGTGPYRFVEWRRGQHILLERNGVYWGGAPAIEKVTYRFVSEPGTRLAGLSAGEFDLITNLMPEFTAQVPQKINILGLEHPIIILNADGGITKDPRVRQALNYAVDKQALAEGLFEGFAQVAQGQLLSPSFFGFNTDVGPYPYDPAKAHALLKEAGVVGAEVELIGTAGRWLKDRELVEAVSAYWDAVGLTTKVRIFEFNEYLNRLFDRKTRGDGIFVVSSNELLDADKSFSAYYKAGGIGSSNTDALLASLIDRARTETDAAKRAGLYHQAVKRAHDQAYFVWLLNIEDIYGLSTRLAWPGRVDAKLLVAEMKLKK